MNNSMNMNKNNNDIYAALPYIPSELKWEILSYVIGEPHDNYSHVLYELSNYWFDMETECEGEDCEKICWSKDMVKKQTAGTTYEYCSNRCASYSHWSMNYDMRKSTARQARNGVFAI